MSLEARPDGSTGWSMAWKAAIWARLHEGDRAYRLVNRLFVDGARLDAKIDAGAELDHHAGGVMGNLLDAHPPFQIDGNFGYAAAVCEMLVQSHLGFVELLPALPYAWKDGAVSGLCVRGGFEIDLAWRDRVPREITLRSKLGGDCRLRTDLPLAIAEPSSGATLKREGDLVILSTSPGEEVRLHVAKP